MNYIWLQKGNIDNSVDRIPVLINDNDNDRKLSKYYMKDYVTFSFERQMKRIRKSIQTENPHFTFISMDNYDKNTNNPFRLYETYQYFYFLFENKIKNPKKSPHCYLDGSIFIINESCIKFAFCKDNDPNYHKINKEDTEQRRKQRLDFFFRNLFNLFDNIGVLVYFNYDSKYYDSILEYIQNNNEVSEYIKFIETDERNFFMDFPESYENLSPKIKFCEHIVSSFYYKVNVEQKIDIYKKYEKYKSETVYGITFYTKINLNLYVKNSSNYELAIPEEKLKISKSLVININPSSYSILKYCYNICKKYKNISVIHIDCKIDIVSKWFKLLIKLNSVKFVNIRKLIVYKCSNEINNFLNYLEPVYYDKLLIRLFSDNPEKRKYYSQTYSRKKYKQYKHFYFQKIYGYYKMDEDEDTTFGHNFRIKMFKKQMEKTAGISWDD